jgi:hypothetical protein
MHLLLMAGDHPAALWTAIKPKRVNSLYHYIVSENDGAIFSSFN